MANHTHLTDIVVWDILIEDMQSPPKAFWGGLFPVLGMHGGEGSLIIPGHPIPGGFKQLGGMNL